MVVYYANAEKPKYNEKTNCIFNTVNILGLDRLFSNSIINKEDIIEKVDLIYPGLKYGRGFIHFYEEHKWEVVMYRTHGSRITSMEKTTHRGSIPNNQIELTVKFV